jgi:hypothetical protein
MSAVTRVQLSQIVNVQVSPARVRRFIDKKGINRLVEEEIAQIKTSLNSLKKEGAPQVSAHPTKPEGDDVEASVMTAYDKAVENYNAEAAAYKAFKSPNYNKLASVYKLVKLLNKLETLLTKKDTVSTSSDTKKKFTAKNTEEVTKLTALINASEFSAYRGALKCNNLASVTSTISDLTTVKFPDLKFFIAKDAASARRIRFNDHASVAMATVMDAIVEQMADHAMNYAMEHGKKIIKPDHCVSSGLEGCSLFPLFNNLPAMTAVRDRQARRVAYDTKVKFEQDEHNRKAKADARRRKKTYKPTKIDHESFATTEVNAGYARFQDTSGEGEEVKTKCVWFGIEVPSSESDSVDSTDFVHFATDVCKNVKKGNDTWSEIRISTDIKNFFSDILIQFVARMLPLINLLINSKKNETTTVCNKVVMRVIEILLADSNHNAQGEVTFSDEHKELFKTVGTKLALLEDHNKKTTPEVTQTETPAEVKPAPRRRQKATK